MQICEEDGRLLARISRGLTRLYMLELHITRLVCLTVQADEESWRWHARFGHTGFATLQKMGREEAVRGMPILEQVE
jgi:hypothetical protein